MFQSNTKGSGHEYKIKDIFHRSILVNSIRKLGNELLACFFGALRFSLTLGLESELISAILRRKLGFRDYRPIRHFSQLL